jgi:hypothetical protein
MEVGASGELLFDKYKFQQKKMKRSWGWRLMVVA